MSFCEPACDRGCLLDFTNQYLNAMLAHDPSGLRVASDLTTTENGKPLRLGEGLWTTAKAISVQQSFADAAAGETGSFGVVQKESGERNRFALRVKVEHQQIVEVEILVE